MPKIIRQFDNTQILMTNFFLLVIEIVQFVIFTSFKTLKYLKK